MKNFENQLKPENNNPQTLQEKILVIEKKLGVESYYSSGLCPGVSFWRESLKTVGFQKVD